MAFESETVQAGAIVTFRYKLTNDEGQVIDESGDEGMPYLHGAGNIVPGLERQMQSRAVGDKFRAVVPPKEGYGLRKGPVQEVPRSKFPPNLQLEKGMELFAQPPGDEEPIPMWIVDFDDRFVQIDPSHPLAGETLTFDIEIVGIRKATEEELKHGHPHEDDECDHDCCCCGGDDEDDGCCCGQDGEECGCGQDGEECGCGQDGEQACGCDRGDSDKNGRCKDS